MLDLVMLNVPGTLEINAPMAAPAILKAAVIKSGLSCKTIDFNVRFVTEYKNKPLFADLTNFFINQSHTVGIYDHATTIVDQWIKELINLQPKYVGISVFTYQSRTAAELFCFSIRKLLPNTKIILGGQGILDGGINGDKKWIDYLDSLQLFDHWVLSEGESVIIDILKNKANKEVNNFNYTQEMNLDSLSYPDYSDYDFDLYQQKMLPITGSRGCVRNCTFCDIHTHWKKFVWRSGEQIADEMIAQSQKYKINYFAFTDSLVNGNQKEYRKMIKILAEYNSCSKQPIKWSGQFILRPRSASDNEMWRLTGLSGANRLAIGIESGSESVRQHIGKEFSNRDIDHAMDLMEKYKITCAFLMLFGYPTETEKDFNDTIDMFRRYKKYANTVIQHIEFGSTLGILPQTPLESNKEQLGLIIDPENENFWISKNNPGLDFKERLRRRFVARHEAEQLGYDLKEDHHRDLLMNFWETYKQKKIIPIKMHA
jgi:radical SAM superfamily enzyme YgiQ (UPF0313 family)